MKKIHIAGIILMLIAISNVAVAKRSRFLFDGQGVIKQEESHGKIVSSSYCKNKIDIKKYKLWLGSTYDLEHGPGNTYVSPDGNFFVFDGAADGPWGKAHFLLADISNCRIVRELETGYPDTYELPQRAVLTSATFSPDSKKLFVQWSIANSSSPNANTISFFNLTKEYSGKNFEAERILKNMPVLGRFSAHEQIWWIYSYKFSKHGDLLVQPKASLKPNKNITRKAYVYDIAHDKILASFNEKNLDLNKNKKYFKVNMSKYYNADMMNIEPEVPDITKDYLLYNFDTPTGTEMDVFDYNSKKNVSRIINAQKGLGTFSGDGKKIIFSEFPNTTTWKRNVIVYDKSTGSVLGQAVLDEQDDIVDVSSDNTKLIYKRHGVQKTVNIR